jgi:hypothetical protein
MFIFASSLSNSQAGVPQPFFRIDLGEREDCAKLLRRQFVCLSGVPFNTMSGPFCQQT